MSNPIPSSLALTTIPTGSEILSSTHDTNYSAIQSAVNEIITALNTGTSGQVLQSVGGAAVQWAAGSTTYRKTTAKQVVNTVTDTDLLNGEITVAGNAIGASGLLRLSAFGDWKQNSGAGQANPRLKLKLGATTLLDTSVAGSAIVGNDPTRYSWWVDAQILNLGAANSQWATIRCYVLHAGNGLSANQTFTTGEGSTYTIYQGSGFVGSRMDGQASAAVDTTASQALALTVILPTANAALDMTLKGALVEIL